MYSRFIKPLTALLLLSLNLATLSACSDSSAAGEGAGVPPPPALPVIALTELPATVYQEYSASLEGKEDIQIRPQVDGILERLYVDEGARVRKGQLLFAINERPFREALNTARANLAAARAAQASAKINVTKLEPLVQNNVVSNVQLQTARAAFDAAAAQVQQAASVVRSAEINLGYTRITAPVDGYIGRLPFKQGSLVNGMTPEPLTVISELKTVYAYFSLSEDEFLRFREQYPGNTLEEKIRQVPPVELLLADGTTYAQKGKVEIVNGQFTSGIGAITFRAAFPNGEGQLRSGNTGKVRLPLQLPASIAVPKEATYEMQDKLFVFALGDSNKVSSRAIRPAGGTNTYYFVKEGLRPGDRIVYSGTDRLRDGMVIQPQPIPMDSVLRVSPLK